MRLQAAQPLGDRDARLVPKIATGRVIVEPVRRRKLAHQKSREGRLALSARQVVDQFQQSRGRESERAADRSPNRREARCFEQPIDDLPERNELALRYEIDAPATADLGARRSAARK